MAFSRTSLWIAVICCASSASPCPTHRVTTEHLTRSRAVSRIFRTSCASSCHLRDTIARPLAHTPSGGPVSGAIGERGARQPASRQRVHPLRTWHLGRCGRTHLPSTCPLCHRGDRCAELPKGGARRRACNSLRHLALAEAGSRRESRTSSRLPPRGPPTGTREVRGQMRTDHAPIAGAHSVGHGVGASRTRSRCPVQPAGGRVGSHPPKGPADSRTSPASAARSGVALPEPTPVRSSRAWASS